MPDHDPLCPWQPYAEEDMNSRWSYGCQCALIARVRADAEVLADDWRHAWREVRDERDVARAEVAALREQIAQQVEAIDPRRVPHAEPSGWWQGFADAQGIAARIARGGAR